MRLLHELGVPTANPVLQNYFAMSSQSNGTDALKKKS